MATVRHLTTSELEAGLAYITQSPKDHGILKLIVRRPKEDERETPEVGDLALEEGLVGDYWFSEAGPEHPDTQLTIMNARVAELVAQDSARWQLAGDQLYLDLDLSEANLPPGTRLALGSAVLEVTAVPHTGCKKFVSRFGMDAMNFVNSPQGKRLHLRGIYTKVVQPGLVRIGDTARKIRLI
jgi:MOSC domain-containing protein YiiM